MSESRVSESKLHNYTSGSKSHSYSMSESKSVVMISYLVNVYKDLIHIMATNIQHGIFGSMTIDQLIDELRFCFGSDTNIVFTTEVVYNSELKCVADMKLKELIELYNNLDNKQDDFGRSMELLTKIKTYDKRDTTMLVSCTKTTKTSCCIL